MHPLIRAAIVVVLVTGIVGANAQRLTPIRVIQTLPLTGPQASYGQAKADGAQAYIQKINRQGGVNGRLVEVTTMDDGYDPKRAVENLRKMAAETKPAAVLGLFGVPVVAAAVPVLDELQIPAVGLTSGAPSLRSPLKKYVLPVRASYADEAPVIVRDMQLLQPRNIAVIYQQNPFGELVRDVFVSALKDAKIGHFATPLTANAEIAVNAIATKDVDAIFLAMLSGPAVQTIKQLRANAATRSLRLYAPSPIDTSVLINALGSDAAGVVVAQIVPDPRSRHMRIASHYQADMAALGRGSSSFYGLEAYIEAAVLVEGLRRAGKNASEPASVVAALESFGDTQFDGYPIKFSASSRRGSNFVELTMINRHGGVTR